SWEALLLPCARPLGRCRTPGSDRTRSLLVVSAVGFLRHAPVNFIGVRASGPPVGRVTRFMCAQAAGVVIFDQLESLNLQGRTRDVVRDSRGRGRGVPSGVEARN